MASSQLLDIFLIAMVAGVILFRLYTVLGRRTGEERPPQENYRLSAPPGAGEDGAMKTVEGPSVARTVSAARPADPVAGGLHDIQLADRGFDKDHFVAGARAAVLGEESAESEGSLESGRFPAVRAKEHLHSCTSDKGSV